MHCLTKHEFPFSLFAKFPGYGGLFACPFWPPSNYGAIALRRENAQPKPRLESVNIRLSPGEPAETMVTLHPAHELLLCKLLLQSMRIHTQ
jgi:hypothetical protein